MKKLLLLVLFCLPLLFFSQEKSKILYNYETLNISLKDGLFIESTTNQKRLIPKSKNIQDYTIYIPFDHFSEIKDIKGKTYNINKKKSHLLRPFNVSTGDIVRENIFFSDSKYKHLNFSYVEDNSTVEFSYKKKFKEPKLLSFFRFQDELATQKSIFKIVCDSKIDMGFKLFGEFQDRIVFNKTENNGITTYSWETDELPPYELEEDMPHPSYFQPHLIYYIKSFEKYGDNIVNLESVADLYKWYNGLTKNINQKDQTNIINTVNELIKDKKTETEKAKSIFNWVQQNLNYVAFEYAMGGFIPRDAVDIYNKKYGDCKDMANLLNEMLKHAEIETNLTWIGTRDKPYLYEDVPTPVVDNHMITSAILDNKRYFLDATDKFCPFLLPSQMIQGKEALVGINDDEFQIIKIPAVDSKINKYTIQFDINLEETDLTGTIETEMSGFIKGDLQRYLSKHHTREDEILKNIIVDTNGKIDLVITNKEQNTYESIPAKVNFTFKIENWIKQVNNKIILKPLLIYPLKENYIDLEKRIFPFEKRNTFAYSIQYSYSIPENYSIEFLPENFKYENDLASFEMKYKLANNTIVVNQNIESKVLKIEKKDFETWNEILKKLNKLYNQSILLKNE